MPRRDRITPLAPVAVGTGVAQLRAVDERLARIRQFLGALSLYIRDVVVRRPNTVRTVAGAIVLAAIVCSWFTYRLLASLPDREDLRALGEVVEGTTLYDAYDRPIFSIPTQYRIEVPLARMSSHLRNAMVAVEDARFYDHDGIDGIRVVGAIVADIRKGRAAEGASTITQQLARISFLSRDKTLPRKLREAILAQRIERLYSKDEILELYLNKAYFGDGLYGAEAAAAVGCD
jgi:membrane peptidoglycan carboxypeptidase